MSDFPPDPFPMAFMKPDGEVGGPNRPVIHVQWRDATNTYVAFGELLAANEHLVCVRRWPGQLDGEAIASDILWIKQECVSFGEGGYIEDAWRLAEAAVLAIRGGALPG